jgi:CHAD domain-containing protein
MSMKVANGLRSNTFESGSSQHEPFTLGEFALTSIQKHFHKSIRHEKEILQDKDPEPLHQMRVGMRRLRTALVVFGPFVSLSTQLERDITKISKSLGSVRDLDVLGLWLQGFISESALDEHELKQSKKVLQRLHRRRQRQFEKMYKMLKGHRYRQFVEAFQKWLKHPSFQAGAAWPIQQVLPDLLLPLIDRLLLHPGWLVAIAPHQESADPLDRGSPNAEITGEQVELYLAKYGTVLHDLRKQAKRVRYQTEFFKDFYGSDYAEQILDFRAIQDLLGQLQDSQVFDDFLIQEIGSQWKKTIPSLERYLRKQHLELWQQWQPIQQKYLQTQFRDDLRMLLLRPAIAPSLSQ